MELYQLCVTIIFALGRFDFFCSLALQDGPGLPVLTVAQNMKNDNVSVTTKWILTKLCQNTQVRDIRPIWASCIESVDD